MHTPCTNTIFSQSFQNPCLRTRSARQSLGVGQGNIRDTPRSIGVEHRKVHARLTKTIGRNPFIVI